MTRLLPILGNLDDLAEAIAEPNPRRPFENAVGNFGRRVCDRLSASPQGSSVALLGIAGDICGPYWDEQGYSAPEAESPFSGGQCPISYRPTGTFIQACNPNAGNTEVWIASDAGPGPISGIVFEGERPEIAYADGSRATLRTGSSLVLVRQTGTPLCSGFTTPSRFAQPGSVQITAVNPQGGGVDNCGDPPPDVNPGPVPAPDPGPLPPGTGIVFNIEGNPILVLPPTINLSPEVELGIDVGDVIFGGGTPAVGALDKPLVEGGESEGANGGEGGVDDFFGAPPDGERWVGCCIRLTEVPVGQPPIPGSTPEDVYPRVVGNARLLFEATQGRTSDTPVQIRSKGVCLWEPVRGLRPTGVFVDLLPGYSYARTPYSVEVD